MTAAQLETLHKSDEYAKLRELLGTMARLRNASQRPDDVAIGEVRQAFNLYLSRISRVLDPGPYNKDFGLEVICHVLPTVAGIATFVGDGGSVTSLLRGMMATISTYDFLHKKLEKVLQSHRSKDNLEIKADFYLTGDFLAET